MGLTEVIGSWSISSLHYNEVLLFLGALSTGLVLILWWSLRLGSTCSCLCPSLPSTLDSGPASHKAWLAQKPQEQPLAPGTSELMHSNTLAHFTGEITEANKGWRALPGPCIRCSKTLYVWSQVEGCARRPEVNNSWTNKSSSRQWNKTNSRMHWTNQ